MIAPVVIADDVTGVGVANDWLVPLVYLGATGVFLYDNQDIIKDIILENRVLKQIGKLIRGNRNGDGFTYKLVPKVDGDYDNVRTGEKVHLTTEDVWKYGETIQGVNRYSQKSYEKKYFNMIPVYEGNKTQILVAEKWMLLKYYLEHGELPPGNKRFH